MRQNCHPLNFGLGDILLIPKNATVILIYGVCLLTTILEKVDYTQSEIWKKIDHTQSQECKVPIVLKVRFKVI